MELTFITLAVGLTFSLLLVPRFGVTGLMITILVSTLPSLAIGLWWTRKHFGVTVDWRSSARILAASAIAAIVTQLILSQLFTLEWIRLVGGGTIFLFIYLVVTPLVRAVSTDDIENLRQMLSELGPFSRFSDSPLNLIEKLAKISKDIEARVHAN